MPLISGDKKDTYIRVRITEREKALIKKHAKKNNLTISDYVREKILNPERQANNETTT